jgi:hypothetical protein
MRTHYGPWQPCWISNQHQKHKSGRRPSNEHFWQVWFKSVQWFQKLTCEMWKASHDKSSHGLWPGELIKEGSSYLQDNICTKFLCHYNMIKICITGKRELMTSPCVIYGCVHIFYRYYWSLLCYNFCSWWLGYRSYCSWQSPWIEMPGDFWNCCQTF